MHQLYYRCHIQCTCRVTGKLSTEEIILHAYIVAVGTSVLLDACMHIVKTIKSCIQITHLIGLASALYMKKCFVTILYYIAICI